MAMSEKTQAVLAYLKEIDGANVTSADISEALGGDEAGYSKKTIDGVVTSGLQRKGLAERVPAEIELEDGTHKSVKFIHLTEAGKAFVPGVDDVEAAKAE